MSQPIRARFSPQDHFKLRLPSDPQISSDGRFVAYVRTRADVQADEWITELCVALASAASSVQAASHAGRQMATAWPLCACRAASM